MRPSVMRGLRFNVTIAARRRARGFLSGLRIDRSLPPVWAFRRPVVSCAAVPLMRNAHSRCPTPFRPRVEREAGARAPLARPALPPQR
ncbi:hypothetical protein METUNv1_03338 [Methyloversatilis universalis FAM5]|uniref:Uncharacterized protein n=1 Tax=Methyloversatilis universalis (strain ATCC BAA-1314 / DSM 25237 / JCM 13912 / CCUG 52030 / FAM5) TaxID=1000565 RepID=F5RGJ6_METUF|nr:hypothetical protein METUNv1_03338 [Methyloversatilis universalis FAM5]